jgi:hypothetical protein
MLNWDFLKDLTDEELDRYKSRLLWKLFLFGWMFPPIIPFIAFSSGWAIQDEKERRYLERQKQQTNQI